MTGKATQAFRLHRSAIRQVIDTHRGRNPRVFGSVARGDDTDGSDLDLLIDTTETTSLFNVAAMELDLERLLGISVHVTTSGALRGGLRERVLSEAEPV